MVWIPVVELNVLFIFLLIFLLLIRAASLLFTEYEPATLHALVDSRAVVFVGPEVYAGHPEVLELKSHGWMSTSSC